MARKAKTKSKHEPKLLTPRQTVKTPANRPQTVSFIGAGRLGTALALALSDRGYLIESVVTRNIAGARRVARLLDPKTLAIDSDHLDQVARSKVIFITTPDDAIESIAKQLSSNFKPGAGGHVALHASGALSSESLRSLRAKGFETGSMHPLVSVSDPRTGAESLRNAHFCIEGQPAAVRIARSMVRALGGKSFSIRTRDKALYHAAAVMTSGHTVALFDIATEMLTRCGLTEKQAHDALLPLLTSTVENLSHLSPARALTGTFARADAATVLKHLDALEANSESTAHTAYKLLGLRSLELAFDNGADVANLKTIKRILEDSTASSVGRKRRK